MGDSLSASARRRVLLVEDSENVRSVLRTMLENDAVGVVEASDGNEGLECLKADDTIGLVFLDMHMPGIDGIEVLRQIRAEPAFESLPVVLMTGDSGSSAAAARSLGVAGLLQKPVRYDAVIKIARTFVPPAEPA